jgi:hypothetical protein
MSGFHSRANASVELEIGAIRASQRLGPILHTLALDGVRNTQKQI